MVITQGHLATLLNHLVTLLGHLATLLDHMATLLGPLLTLFDHFLHYSAIFYWGHYYHFMGALLLVFEGTILIGGKD